jgi:colicin import membrane protein
MYCYNWVPKSQWLSLRVGPAWGFLARAASLSGQRSFSASMILQMEQQTPTPSQGAVQRSKPGRADWDGEAVGRKIVEKLRKEGRGGDDTEATERMARAQTYRLKKQMEKYEQEEKERQVRIARELEAEKERKEAEEREREEKKGWFSSLFG